MPLLHIEPEELRYNAYRLTHMAEEIEWAVERLQRANQNLEVGWVANGRFQFQTELEHRIQTLQHLAHQIREQSMQLQREVAKWEAVSNIF
ncbi:MAG: hypothetical protein DWQ04_15550 [Chloroflexi bacterium]|nr:MAG: hypothetical protein DWQ04_15550 [Chloroflexota bacterium]